MRDGAGGDRVCCAASGGREILLKGCKALQRINTVRYSSREGWTAPIPWGTGGDGDRGPRSLGLRAGPEYYHSPALNIKTSLTKPHAGHVLVRLMSKINIDLPNQVQQKIWSTTALGAAGVAVFANAKAFVLATSVGGIFALWCRGPWSAVKSLGRAAITTVNYRAF